MIILELLEEGWRCGFAPLSFFNLAPCLCKCLSVFYFMFMVLLSFCCIISVPFHLVCVSALLPPCLSLVPSVFRSSAVPSFFFLVSIFFPTLQVGFLDFCVSCPPPIIIIIILVIIISIIIIIIILTTTTTTTTATTTGRLNEFT